MSLASPLSRQNRSRRWLLPIGALLALGVAVAAGAYLFADEKEPKLAPYVVPPLAERYSNPAHRFALTMPAGFTVRESTDGVVDTIVFENEKAEGIQVTVSPYEDVKVITADDIRRDIPDMAVDEAQPVEIGANHTGVAFKSDNASFDGASREVWFVFQGELYQISTYDRFDGLLRAMFATWQFDATPR